MRKKEKEITKKFPNLIIVKLFLHFDVSVAIASCFKLKISHKKIAQRLGVKFKLTTRNGYFMHVTIFHT